MSTEDKRQHILRRRNGEFQQFLTKKGLTQKELAARLGYTEGYLSHIRNGYNTATPAFRWRFQQEFGIEAAQEIDAWLSPDGNNQPPETAA